MSNFVAAKLTFLSFFMLQFPDNMFPADTIAAKAAEEQTASLKNLTFDDFVSRLASGTVDLAISLAVAIAVELVVLSVIRVRTNKKAAE